MAQEFVDAKLPIDEYAVDTGDLRPHQREVFERAKEAARLAGPIYREQKQILRPYKDYLSDLAKTDPLAKSPLTLPDKDGKFIYYWEHPVILPYLRKAQSILLSASALASDAGDYEVSEYFYIAGSALTTGDRDKVLEAYINFNSRINFHLLPVETEWGKLAWNGYAAITDREETRKVKQDIQKLREVGGVKNGKWFTPRTEISVDSVGIMAGYLGMEAQSQRRRESGLDDLGTGISAENLPNEPELVTKFGTRLIIFRASFEEVLNDDILRKSKLFLDPHLIPTLRGTMRFLTAHELMHDERYGNHLGCLHSVVRESYANQGGIDLSADVWDPEEKSYQMQAIIEGGLGYAIRDCFEIITGQITPHDLEGVAKLSNYIPDALKWLNLGIEDGTFTIRDGQIVNIDLPRAISLSKTLARDLRLLLQKGTEQDARNYFEDTPLSIPLLSKNRAK